jgi:hypothetical protein
MEFRDSIRSDEHDRRTLGSSLQEIDQVLGGVVVEASDELNFQTPAILLIVHYRTSGHCSLILE